MEHLPPFLSDQYFRYLQDNYSILLNILHAVVYPALTALGLKAAAMLNRNIPSDKVRDLLSFGKRGDG